MKPSHATQCLLQISAWIADIHFCIRCAIAHRARRHFLHVEWWLGRAKIHAATLRFMQHEYQSCTPPNLQTSC